MIAANQRIFARLEDFVKEAGLQVAPGQKRYIQTNEEEKEWLKRVKLRDQKVISPNLKAYRFEFNSAAVFVFVGWDASVIFESVLQPRELNAGLFTAMLADLQIEIAVNTDPKEIFENVIDAQGESDLVGFEFQNLVKFFEPLLVFDLRDDSIIPADNLLRISGLYLCKNYKKLALPFTPETIELYERLFLQGDENINYENLLFSLVSVSWRHSFLDVYRCIEHLFPIVALSDIHGKVKPSVGLYGFSAEMERMIGWHPQEDSCLIMLFSTMSPQAFSELRSAIDPKGTFTSVANRLYKIRNSIVHYRPATEIFSIENNKWDQLIRGVLLLIEQKYAEFHDAFN